MTPLSLEQSNADGDSETGGNASSGARWSVGDYYAELLEAERAKTKAAEDREGCLRYLIGYYGAEASRSRSAGFKALVEKMTAVLDGELDFDTLSAPSAGVR